MANKTVLMSVAAFPRFERPRDCVASQDPHPKGELWVGFPFVLTSQERDFSSLTGFIFRGSANFHSWISVVVMCARISPFLLQA